MGVVVAGVEADAEEASLVTSSVAAEAVGTALEMDLAEAEEVAEADSVEAAAAGEASAPLRRREETSAVGLLEAPRPLVRPRSLVPRSAVAGMMPGKVVISRHDADVVCVRGVEVMG